MNNVGLNPAVMPQYNNAPENGAEVPNPGAPAPIKVRTYDKGEVEVRSSFDIQTFRVRQMSSNEKERVEKDCAEFVKGMQTLVSEIEKLKVPKGQDPQGNPQDGIKDNDPQGNPPAGIKAECLKSMAQMVMKELLEKSESNELTWDADVNLSTGMEWLSRIKEDGLKERYFGQDGKTIGWKEIFNFPGRPESDGVLSLSNDNMVCLHRRMPLEAAGEDELADGLEDFVVSLVDWRERVKNGPDGGEQPSERREDLRLDGFLRV